MNRRRDPMESLPDTQDAHDVVLQGFKHQTALWAGVLWLAVLSYGAHVVS